MKKVILLLVIFAVAGCSPDVKTIESNWFNLPEHIELLVNNMGNKTPSVRKSFNLNGVLESKTFNAYDSGFWVQEFAKLTSLDLNSPQIRDYVELSSGIEDNNSNLLIDYYAVTEESKSALKEVYLYYLNSTSDLRQIKVVLNESSLVTSSRIDISIWLNRYQNLLLVDSMKTKGVEKMFLQSPRKYENTIKVLW